MCHSRWEDWETLLNEERREEEKEPRITEVAAEPEAVEPEPERDPERELIRV